MWNALEAASGAAVAKVAAAFTSQAGVPLIVAEGRCVDGEQRLALRQDRFTIRNPGAEPQHWNVPIVYGPIPATHSPRTVVLEEPFELAAGRCGEAVKLNLGDVGYYRVRYDAATQALLARSLGAMAPVDRVNLLADAWALVESGQGAPASYFTLIEQLGGESNRAVWDQVMRTLSRIDHLEQERPQRAAFQAYARMRLRTLFDRLGWKPADGETADLALLRPRLVRVLGDLGDAAIVAEAKRRFAAFLADASSLPADLRDPVLHLVGRDADRATYDMLIGLARKTTQTGERMRYFSAAASARDPALAKETLALSLTEELPNSMVGTLISWVASQGEHRALALDFVLANYAALVAKQSPSFRNNFVANLMTNFADRKRAAELDEFAPAHESSGGRIMAARARERILTDADFVEQELPAIDDWIARHQSGR
jgi:aminopeptidase N